MSKMYSAIKREVRRTPKMKDCQHSFGEPYQIDFAGKSLDVKRCNVCGFVELVKQGE